jgi:cytosine/adenosine deaminase-related metal-dependent hydrolase
MLKRRTAVWLMGASVLMLAACLNAQENGAKPQQVAIRAARLIDGKSDAVMSNGVVLVEGEKITAVASGIAIPSDAKVIDLGDATLLPGLIDVHTHLLLEMMGPMSQHKIRKCFVWWRRRVQRSGPCWERNWEERIWKRASRRCVTWEIPV